MVKIQKEKYTELKNKLSKAVLACDPTLRYSDISVEFRDFNDLRPVIYVDQFQKLHILMDDVFLNFSYNKLRPIVIHLFEWHEQIQPYMYPGNIWLLFSRPAILDHLMRKFDRMYRVPTVDWEEPKKWNDARRLYMEKFIQKHPLIYGHVPDTKVWWRRASKDLSKVTIADTDVFGNRIYLDPAVMSAPLSVVMYILAHEFTVIRTFDVRTLSPNYDKFERVMGPDSDRVFAENYMKEHGWRFKYDFA